MPHKLLLADDSVTIQRVIELTFADEDVQVIAVGDGQEAIDEHPGRSSRHRPGRRRHAGARRLRGGRVHQRHAELAHIPVLLLTGAFEPVDEARARAVGCDGVLVKPFEPQMVISRVKDLLAGRKPAGCVGRQSGGADAVPPGGPAGPGCTLPAAAGGRGIARGLLRSARRRVCQPRRASRRRGAGASAPRRGRRSSSRRRRFRLRRRFRRISAGGASGPAAATRPGRSVAAGIPI